LSLEWSKYKLSSKIENSDDIREVMEIEKNTKEKLAPFNEKLGIIQSLKNYVREEITNKVDIKEVKENIKKANPDLYNVLQLDLVTSLEQVMQWLDYLYDKTEKEKDKILKKYRKRIDEIVSKNTIEAKEKDKGKKETLKYLNQIKFDLFPQSLTSQLIKEYKTTAMVIPLPWWRILNKETMNLENGMFWEPITEAWWDKMKDNLVMFMEKAIYGEIWSKNSIFKWLDFKMWATIDPIDFNKAVEENWILSEGSWSIDTIRNNLKKSTSNEQKQKKVEWSDWYSE